MVTLADFVRTKREEAGLSLVGLSRKINASIEELEDIESGKELFLPVTLRQKLAKGLKCQIIELKELEKDVTTESVSIYKIDEIKTKILNGETDILCPKCGSPLIIKIVKMYDLEDNPVFHPKAHCSKCIFQIKD
ncbi:helix-turn-helix domain-containing protein [bacterium]|nr:helix-turn-helix domain-containing protein [bacterium]